MDEIIAMTTIYMLMWLLVGVGVSAILNIGPNRINKPEISQKKAYLFIFIIGGPLIVGCFVLIQNAHKIEQWMHK